MGKWSPRAIIVLVLAIAISLAHTIAVISAAWQGRSITDAGGDVLVAVMGAIIAIIAAYVGQPTTTKKDDDAIPKDGEG